MSPKYRRRIGFFRTSRAWYVSVKRRKSLERSF